MKKTLFIKNAAILTASGIVLRLLGTVFKIWVASKVGAAGMGLYQLIISVYIFVSSFAQSGISTAVTRLTADNLSKGFETKPILIKSIILTEIIALTSSVLLFFFSPFAAGVIIGDKSSAAAIKILCLGLPFIGVCSCLRGYFIAVRKAAPCASSQIIEQAVRIIISFLFVSKFIGRGVGFICACLVGADVVSEIISCLYLYLSYKFNIKKEPSGLHKARKTYKNIIRIAFPLTLGRYLGSLLRTAENMLVPKRLSKSGAGYKGGLSVFGSIKAMTLPIMLFPASLLTSVSLLLIPEISSARCKMQNGIVRCITNRIIKITMIFSCIFAALFGVAGKEIGQLLYKSNEVGSLLCVLSPIVPLMYLDCICDGLLKGLDCQKFSFFVGIADSGFRIIAVLLTLHKFGITAFIIIMYISNFFTSALSTGKLIRTSNAEIDILKWVFIPLCSAITVTKAASIGLKTFTSYGNLVYIILLFAISLTFYFLILFLFGTLNSDDIKAFVK